MPTDRTDDLGEHRTHRRREILGLTGVTAATVGLGSGLATAIPDEARRPDDVPGRGPPDDDDDLELPPRPGPGFLYEDAEPAPQFESTGVWSADPLLIMGADGYVDGEYLYQGFAYDDYGARTGDTENQRPTDTFSGATGDVRYPTDESTYGYNAADLLEVRTTTTDEGVTYRITLTTMIEPDVAGVAIGIDTGDDGGADDWGYGIGSLGELDLDHVLVTWGEAAELDGEPVESTVDLARNQIEVTVPLEPEGDTWRHYLVTGLFDAETRAFKQIEDEPDADHPGGAFGQDIPPVFCVGFRDYDQEPMGGATLNEDRLDENGETLAEGEGSSSYGFWREHAQAIALADRDISAFHADVDFGKVDEGETEIDAPEEGIVNRVYGSRFDLGEGIGENDGGDVVMYGRVQPYAAYIPKGYDPEEPAPMHLHMHSLTSNYNQYTVSSSTLLEQLGEQRNAIILTPQGRGPGLFYHDEGELDVFEAWSDLATHYAIDWERVTIGGYSMGGFGTFSLAGRYPDLFAKGFPVVASDDDVRLLDSLRHVPLMMWNGALDELVHINTVLETHEALLERAYRHELRVFPHHDHFMFSLRDQWGPARDFLEGATVPAYPWHVTYHTLTDSQNPLWNLVHDRAYWITDIEFVDDAESGRVDVKDLAAGRDDPVTETYEEPGSDPDVHVARGLEWIEQPAVAPANALEVELDAVEAGTLWIDATDVDPEETITLITESTTPATLTLRSHVGDATVSITSGSDERMVELG